MKDKLYHAKDNSYQFGAGSSHGDSSPIYSDNTDSYDFRKKRAGGGAIDDAPSMAAASRNSANLPPMKRGGAMHRPRGR